jgi:hypothetical protein
MVKDIISKLEELDGITTKIHKSATGLEFLEIFHLNNSIVIGSINQGHLKYPLPMFPEWISEMEKIVLDNRVLYIAIYEDAILSSGPHHNVIRPQNCLHIDLEALLIIIQFLSHPQYPQYFLYSNLTYAVYYSREFFKFLIDNTDLMKNKNDYLN